MPGRSGGRPWASGVRLWVADECHHPLTAKGSVFSQRSHLRLPSLLGNGVHGHEECKGISLVLRARLFEA